MTPLSSHSLRARPVRQTPESTVKRHAAASDFGEGVSDRFALDLRARNASVSAGRGRKVKPTHRKDHLLNISPVVGHVTLDEVTGGQGGHQGELACQHGGTDHAGQLPGVITGVAAARSLDAEHLETKTKLLHQQNITRPRRPIRGGGSFPVCFWLQQIIKPDS